MNKYVAGYMGRKIVVSADTIYAAKQEAIKLLKPSKAKIGMLWVVLAEANGRVIPHSVTD
jgi:hypothetical protein